MFTGLVQLLGRVVDVAPDRIVVDLPGVDEPLGASIALDGCCLTVAHSEAAPCDLPPSPGAEPIPTSRVAFDVLPETVAATRIGALRAGSVVNVELALRAGEPLGGHLVQGHVDAVGTVSSSERDPGGRWLDLELAVPEQVLRLCVDKGSLTVNGTSLTVMELLAGDAGVRLQLIPETVERTNLGTLAPGDPVNLEADVIARYVDRLLARKQ